MDGLTRGIRLIVGLGMLAAGTTLAAPTALVVARWWQAAQQDAAVSAVFLPEQPALAVPPGQPSAPWAIATGSGLPAASPAEWPAPPAGALPAVRSDYRPPEPPTPLPPTAIGSAGPTPDLSAAYRSTLAVPPPPLIDGQRPPPVAVGWTARFSREVQQRRELSPPPASTYRVCDGDDLTGIATRFYGTPAAATLIWQANRGLLADPAVLPIGLELVLPRPDAAGAQGRSIDPPLGQPGLPAPRPDAPQADPWITAGS